MSKSADAGELRTRIFVYAPTVTVDTAGFETHTYSNIYAGGGCTYCKWVNAFGTELLTAEQMQLKELATLTVRYNPKIKPDCIIYCGDVSTKPFEIIDVNNIDNLGVWLEIKVKRSVKS